MNTTTTTPATTTPLISLKNIKRYFDDGLVCGLNGIDLDIPSGEILGIIGPSGSGKSTLLNIIGTLDFPTEGDYFLAHQKITPQLNLDLLRANSLGFIFQLHHLIPNLTLLENVLLPTLSFKASRRERLEKAEKYLCQVGLKDRLHFLPTKVSGGQRQRAAIARALVNDPQIILGDEPTGNLDSETGLKIMDLLQDLVQNQKKTLVLVTHNPEIAERAHRVIQIVDGHIAKEWKGALSLLKKPVGL
jgi:putative ABC transport system ATP-binding protein